MKVSLIVIVAIAGTFLIYRLMHPYQGPIQPDTSAVLFRLTGVSR